MLREGIMGSTPQICAGCAASFSPQIHQHDVPTLGWVLPRLLLLLGIVLGAGCSTKDEPNSANFERAINAALKERRLCTYVSPMVEHERDHFLAGLARSDAKQAAIVEQVRADLRASKAKVLSTSTLVNLPDKDSEAVRLMAALGAGGLLHGGGPYQHRQVVWLSKVAMLNEKGMAHYVEATESNPVETRKTSRICYGNLVVDKIVRWTAPADMMGHKVVNVEYTRKPVDVADWAGPMLQHLKQDQVRKALLVLTSDGWSVDEPSQVR